MAQQQQPPNAGRLLQVLAHAAAAGYAQELLPCGWSSQAAFTDELLYDSLARVTLTRGGQPRGRGSPFSLGRPAIQSRPVGPLGAAAALGRLPRLHWLLDRGASPNVQMKGGRTPLLWACEEGQVELALRLLEKGADPKVRDHERGFTPLHHAASAGHDHLAAMLLAAGADPRARNSRRETPLHLSCLEGVRADAVSLRLLDAGSPATAPDETQQNAVLYAIHRGSERVVARMLELGVDPDGVPLDSMMGRTYLHYACDSGKAAVALCLASASKYPDARDEWGGLTPLAIARKGKGMEAVVACLLERGVDASGKGKGARQPPRGRRGGDDDGDLASVALRQYADAFHRAVMDAYGR